MLQSTRTRLRSRKLSKVAASPEVPPGEALSLPPRVTLTRHTCGRIDRSHKWTLGAAALHARRGALRHVMSTIVRNLDPSTGLDRLAQVMDGLRRLAHAIARELLEQRRLAVRSLGVVPLPSLTLSLSRARGFSLPLSLFLSLSLPLALSFSLPLSPDHGAIARPPGSSAPSQSNLVLPNRRDEARFRAQRERERERERE